MNQAPRVAVAALTLAAAFGASGCATRPRYIGAARPIEPARFTDEPGWIVAGHVPPLQQRADDDCGAAALAMVANRWQVPMTVPEALGALPPAGKLGARLGDLRDLARARGLTAFAIAGDRATLVHELEAGRPIIVGLQLPYTGKLILPHYEVVVGINPATHQVATIDPAAAGFRTRTFAALEGEWGPPGRPTLIVLGRVDANHPPQHAAN